MRNKKITVLFICVAISVLYLSSSFTYGLVVTKVDKPVFKVTSDNDSYILDLLANSETDLYPGLNVSTPFDIINNSGKKIKLLGINFENFSLKDSQTSEIISRSSDRYEHFISNVHINFRYKDEIIYNGPILGLCDNKSFIFDRSILFSNGAGSEFTIDISMLDSAANDTQNIISNFNLQFNFREHYVAPPPIDPPVDPPIDPPVDETDKPDNTDPPATEDPEDKTDPVVQPEDRPVDNTEDLPPADSEDEKESSMDPHDPDDTTEPIEITDKLIQTGAFFDNTILKGISILFILSGLYMVLKKKS